MATQTATTPGKYVVTADAVVVTTGKKPNGKAEYTRVLRGGVLTGRDTSATIRRLLLHGSIKKVESQDEFTALAADLKDPAKSKNRLTLRKHRKSVGYSADVVAPVIEDVVPRPAPNPAIGVDAGNLTTDSL